MVEGIIIDEGLLVAVRATARGLADSIHRFGDLILSDKVSGSAGRFRLSKCVQGHTVSVLLCFEMVGDRGIQYPAPAGNLTITRDCRPSNSFDFSFQNGGKGIDDATIDALKSLSHAPLVFPEDSAGGVDYHRPKPKIGISPFEHPRGEIERVAARLVELLEPHQLTAVVADVVSENSNYSIFILPHVKTRCGHIHVRAFGGRRQITAETEPVSFCLDRKGFPTLRDAVDISIDRLGDSILTLHNLLKNEVPGKAPLI